MRGIFNLVSAIAILISGGVAVSAETLLPFEDPEPGSRMADYMGLDRVRSDFLAIADAHAQLVGVRCDETGELALHDVYAIQPIVLQDDDEDPSSGI